MALQVNKTFEETHMIDFKGHWYDPLNLKESDLDIEHIAYSLAHINRYNGALGMLSVGAHSCRVHDMIKNKDCDNHMVRSALLHDAEEAYVQDIISCMKYKMPQYLKINSNAKITIQRKFEISDYRAVNIADEIDQVRELKSPKKFHEPDPKVTIKNFLERYEACK